MLSLHGKKAHYDEHKLNIYIVAIHLNGFLLCDYNSMKSLVYLNTLPSNILSKCTPKWMNPSLLSLSRHFHSVPHYRTKILRNPLCSHLPLMGFTAVSLLHSAHRCVLMQEVLMQEVLMYWCTDVLMDYIHYNNMDSNAKELVPLLHTSGLSWMSLRTFKGILWIWLFLKVSTFLLLWTRTWPLLINSIQFNFIYIAP